MGSRPAIPLPRGCAVPLPRYHMTTEPVAALALERTRTDWRA